MKRLIDIEIADPHAEFVACAALLRGLALPSAAADDLRVLHVFG